MTISAVNSEYPAVLFLPQDAFDTEQNQVMGRRVAGRLLAGAFVSQMQPSEILTLVSPGRSGQKEITEALRPLVPQGARVRIEHYFRKERLQAVGALLLPDPLLANWCWLRDVMTPYSFSLTGVTHTLCSEAVLRGLQDLILAPLYEWDAVICTSRAGRQAITAALELRLEAIATRMGGSSRPAISLPQLPIIPLAGTTIQPFYPELSRIDRRTLARKNLGIDANAFVVIFLGRLSFHSKCHPQVLYSALEAIASSKRDIVLIECGHIYNEEIQAAYQDLQSRFPNVTYRLVGGLLPASSADKWQALAGADVFVSLSDNLQETFGLSLLEAMAAELPLVVSDWDGYRDLVEHGSNGFLIPTSDVMTTLGMPDEVELAYAAKQIDYDTMVGLRGFGVAVDYGTLVACLGALRSSPELCARMALEGRRRLELYFSEAAVSSDYRQLWSELADRRAHAAASTESSLRLSPLYPCQSAVFGHYASNVLVCDSIRLSVSRGLGEDLVCNPINKHFLRRIFGIVLEAACHELFSSGQLDSAKLQGLGMSRSNALQGLAAFIKLGLGEKLS